MTKPWGIERLDQVAQVVGRGIAPKYADDGDFLVVNQRCIRDGRVSLDIARRHNSRARKVKADKVLSAGDVLVNSTGVGTLGRTAPLRDVQSSITADSHVTILRPLPDVSSRWFAYAVSALEPEIENLAEGSTGQTELSRHRLADLELTVPPLSEQHTIAATLGALDDKIESNRRATAVGESLIRALVESALDASEGADGTLGDYCRLVKAPVKVEEISADDNYIGLEHMPRGSIFLTEWEKAEGLGSNKTAFQRGDVLFGKLRPYFKKVGIAPVNGVCSTDILAVRPKDPRDLALIAVVAASDALIDSLSAGSTGTRMPRASWKDLAAWQVPVLTSTERAELSDRVAPLVDRLEQLTFESRRLTAVRDALLPELLSGRIRVPAEGVAA